MKTIEKARQKYQEIVDNKASIVDCDFQSWRYHAHMALIKQWFDEFALSLIEIIEEETDLLTDEEDINEN